VSPRRAAGGTLSLFGLRAGRRTAGSGWPVAPGSAGTTRTGLALGAAAAGLAALALTPGDAAAMAARAAIAALAVAAAWALARRRSAPAAPPAVRLAALVPLGRAGEVALLEVDGRRFLVGCGERPVALLAELSRTPERAP